MYPSIYRLLPIAVLTLISACSPWRGIAPDDHVRAYLGDAMAATLEKADVVTVQSGSTDAPLPLGIEAVEDLKSMIFFWSSYVPELQKKCRFRPQASFGFFAGPHPVQVAIDPHCKMWRFMQGETVLFEDYDPVASRMDRLLDTLLGKKEGSKP